MKTVTLDPKLDERLRDAEQRFAEVNDALARPDVLSSPDKLRDLAQERSHLEPIVAAGGRLRAALEELDGATGLLAESEDADMRVLAEAEVARLEPSVEALTAEVRELLVPQDPLGDRAAVVEIRRNPADRLQPDADRVNATGRSTSSCSRLLGVVAHAQKS